MPAGKDVKKMVRNRRPEALALGDDGETPNNPRCALLVYRDVVEPEPGLDPAAVFEKLFAAHGWGRSWRNGIYNFLHFHTRSHEVLGIARGTARVQFGGAQGPIVTVEAGDVVVLPAGTGHQRIGASNDLLVVGAYPPEGDYGETRPGEVDHGEAVARIEAVPLPAADPVYGPNGPLRELWG